MEKNLSVSKTLLNDGDSYEKLYYNVFLSEEFPEYEMFWQRFVVPLTNRSSTKPDIHFQTDQDLHDSGKTSNDLCISQLHYTILLHLIRTFQIRKINPFPPEVARDFLTEAFSRLVGALDCADELLERYISPTVYDPWIEIEGMEARKQWRNTHGDPLKDIRNYRNKLLHGRASPAIIISGSYNRIRFPKVNQQDKYTDWRTVTAGSIGSGGTVRQDFDSPNNIIDDAWKRVLSYLNQNWKKTLLT